MVSTRISVAGGVSATTRGAGVIPAALSCSIARGFIKRLAAIGSATCDRNDAVPCDCSIRVGSARGADTTGIGGPTASSAGSAAAAAPPNAIVGRVSYRDRQRGRAEPGAELPPAMRPR
jgi:hypothetical protein